MNKEVYILIGVCVFAFLIGQRIKRKLAPKKTLASKSKQLRKKQKTQIAKEESPRKRKTKSIFIWIQLVIVFGLLIFMIPALSRDLLTNNGFYDQNLILRILIVAFATYILFMGFVKLNKSKRRSK